QWSVRTRTRPGSGMNQPTAHASSAATAATPVREFPQAPGLGLETTDQAVPSQCSMSDGPPDEVSTFPTAQTSDEDTPETAVRAPESMGALGTFCHAVPSQCRVSGVEPNPAFSHPVAHTSSEAIWLAPYMYAYPGTLGMWTRYQLEPSQCSEIGRSLESIPMAHASVGVKAVTDVRSAHDPGVGLGTRLQPEPSQCSISVVRAPVSPT